MQSVQHRFRGHERTARQSLPRVIGLWVQHGDQQRIRPPKVRVRYADVPDCNAPSAHSRSPAGGIPGSVWSRSACSTPPRHRGPAHLSSRRTLKPSRTPMRPLLLSLAASWLDPRQNIGTTGRAPDGFLARDRNPTRTGRFRPAVRPRGSGPSACAPHGCALRSRLVARHGGVPSGHGGRRPSCRPDAPDMQELATKWADSARDLRRAARLAGVEAHLPAG